MKGNFILNKDTLDLFDHALGLLEDSIKEFCFITQDMLPETLVNLSLKDTLGELCNQISVSKELSAKFTFFGENKRFENYLEIALYQIACKLVNIAVKHAKANEILLLLLQEDNRIHLTVIDNGLIDIANSQELQYIRSEVESLKGIIKINVQPGKGNEIGIEFEIAK